MFEADVMKTLIGTSIVMIAAVAGLWTYANEHADSAGYVFDRERSPEGSAPVIVQDEDVVVRVNGQPITVQDFELALQSFPESARGVMFSPAGRKVIAEELIRLELLAQKAKNEGLADRDDVRDQIRKSRLEAEFVRKNILAQAAVRELVSQQGTTGTPQDLYEHVKDDFETVQARQIIVSYRGSRLERNDLTRTKEEALARASEAVAKLRNGASFEAMHREYGDNPDNLDLGPLRRDSTPPDLAEAIFTLGDGEVSDPVETQWGYHIFQVVSRSIPSFEEVEEQLGRQSRQLWTRVAVDDLREQADVEFDEEFFRKDESGKLKDES